MERFGKTLWWILGIVGVLILLAFGLTGLAVIQGHEVAIHEQWDGIEQAPGPDGKLIAKEYGPGKNFYCHGYDEYIKYDMRKHRYILDDPANVAAIDQDDINGKALFIQVARGQTVKVRIKVVWRYKPGKVGIIHKEARNDPKVAEAKILDTPVKRIVQSLVTPQEALKVYYGDGLVKLQKDFKSMIQTDPAVSELLDVDDAVLYTDLDPDYVLQINTKITAEQKQLAQVEVQKANDAEALAEKSKAEIDKNRRVVAAEAAKLEQVLQAEAAAKKQVLAAEAAKQQAVLAAEGDKEKQRMEGEGLRARKLAEADGVKALKLADAAGEEALKLAKFGGEAGARQTSVMVAEKIADRVTGMLKGVTIVPEKTVLSLVGDLPGAKEGVQKVIEVGKAGE